MGSITFAIRSNALRDLTFLAFTRSWSTTRIVPAITAMAPIVRRIVSISVMGDVTSPLGARSIGSDQRRDPFAKQLQLGALVREQPQEDALRNSIQPVKRVDRGRPCADRTACEEVTLPGKDGRERMTLDHA